MKKLRIGIVGLGRVSSKTHLPVLRTLKDTEVVAGADKNLERAQRVQSLFGLDKVYRSYEEMFTSERLDAVYICLPNFLHRDASRKALETGLHVLCEKPMCMSAEEAEEITAMAENRGLILMPGYKKRYAQNFAKARASIEDGVLGRVIHVQATFVTPGPYISWDPKSDWYLDGKWHGAIYDVGCHIADILLYLLPREVRQMRSVVIHGYRGYDTPTNLACVFEMEGGIIGDITIGWQGATDIVSVSIHGTAGTVHVSRDDYLYLNPGTDPVDKLVSQLIDIQRGIGAVFRKVRDKMRGKDFYIEDLMQAEAFCRAIREMGPPPIDGRSAVRVHRFLQQILASLDDSSSVVTDDSSSLDNQIGGRKWIKEAAGR
jgi:predicted dehydrogenase